MEEEYNELLESLTDRQAKVIQAFDGCLADSSTIANQTGLSKQEANATLKELTDLGSCIPLD